MTLLDEKLRLVAWHSQPIGGIHTCANVEQCNLAFADALLEEVAKRADLATAEWIRSGKGK